jgi:hypothetical protein
LKYSEYELLIAGLLWDAVSDIPAISISNIQIVSCVVFAFVFPIIISTLSLCGIHKTQTSKPDGKNSLKPVLVNGKSLKIPKG